MDNNEDALRVLVERQTAMIADYEIHRQTYLTELAMLRKELIAAQQEVEQLRFELESETAWADHYFQKWQEAQK